jgi:putative NADPH-quinone reductase
MHLCRTAVAFLEASGHRVVVEDLYAQRFEPNLSERERQTYYGDAYDCSAVSNEAQRLIDAEAMVLVFPTWWFGFPAVLKGWFDRVWGPGIAFDHADDFGPIRPRLHRLKRVLAVTALGSPWWVDRLVLRRPVRRVLRSALLGACAPGCKLHFLSLYNSEKPGPRQVIRFEASIKRVLSGWNDSVG